MKLYPRLALLLAAASLCFAQSSFLREPVGRPSTEKDDTLKKVGIDQKLNTELPLHLDFTDENGKAVKLGEYFKSKPVIIAPVYYECPMLCSQILNGLVGSLKAVTFISGEDFEVVAVSFDPAETPEQARKKKNNYVRRFGKPGAEEGWHFLTGTEANIKALMDSMGYRYEFLPDIKQFAHASAVMVATPQGRLSRYLYGVEYAPRDMRLALVEASQGKIGNPIDSVLLYCYHYDPATGKYSAAVLNVIRLLGLALLLALGTFMFMSARRNPAPKIG